ncbi:uncharacterized protein LOC143229849 [Tachypleus tridentatus]|uniref:uncharacterized protein LOC143229849 n=1 Tax=Tachypleus tridentatus TaxID=6853 RepID=UPI003FD28225
MFSPTVFLVFSAWLCFRLEHIQVLSASSSRQRLQNLLNQSPYSGYSASENKEQLDKSPRGSHMESNEGLRNEPSTSYQQFYQTYYGTPERLKSLKRNYGPAGLREALVAENIQEKLEEVRQANDHFLGVRSRTTCKIPRPQVVRVRDIFPDTSKQYVPRCTILHRCSDQTGCCDDDQHKCGPLQVQEVTLYFYTLHLKNHHMEISINNAVEKLVFINHTECECQPINNRPRMHEDHHHHLPLSDSSHRPSDKDSKCKDCPFPFYKRMYPDGRCSCDCFDHQKPCLRIKRGRDPLDDTEKRCVLEGYCHAPDCKYGPYDAIGGKCSKRPENYELKKHKSRKQRRHYHRWAFFERD